MAKGSNDLNALLKAKVVKIKAELDVTGSMPHIKRQVDDISKRLANKPVKLKVVLDNTMAELNKQLRTLTSRLQNSKGFKPIKIRVDIDTIGSATKIKAQLKDVGRAIDEFNAKFSKQINMLGQLNQKLNQEQKKTQQTMGKKIHTPNNADVGGIGVKKYIQQLKQAEAEMRKVFGKQGNFSSFEFKDEEGNLKGFIAQLEKTNGVVQKLRYTLNQDNGKFELIDQQTITQTQKSVEKAMTSLQKLRREIDNMGKGSSKSILANEFKDLENMGRKGMLDQKSVNALNDLIKKEKDLAEVYKYQRKLIEDVAKAKSREKRSGNQNDYGDLQKRVQGTTNLKDLQAQRIEHDKLTASTKKYNDAQTTSQKMDVTRTNMLRQLESATKRAVTQNGLLSTSEAQKTRAMINGMQTQESYIRVQQRMAQMNKQLENQNHLESQRKALNSLKQAVTNWGLATGKSVDTVNRYYEQLKSKAGSSIGAIERQTKRLTNAMTNGTLERALRQQQDSTVKHINGMNNDKFKKLVDNRDIDALKKYVSELNKGSVATMKLVTNSKGMTKIVATMDSATKSARQFSYEISNANRQLRQTGTADVFNANRNLGIMEQMRIAMARVPIWMASMTAFYGTLRGVQAMMREIVEVDKLMTDISRVADSSLNIDTMFDGAVDMSKELGNNLHDILASLGEYARTFGDFNERQLLAITKTATVMSNVSDLTAQEATESLIGTMNAFNISAEESVRIVDALNEVDNNYAISTKQLAEGLSKTASTAKTFGVSMEESIGHITAIGSVTMESGKQIGTGLKTIYSRITTLPKSEEALKGVGISIKGIGDNAEAIRPVNDIIGDLAKVWHTLTDAQRQQISVDIAGTHQLTRFLAMVNNYETALKATQTAHTSHGSAMRENEKYMKSFEARINQLKNSFTEMSLAIGDAFLSGSMLLGIEMLKNLATGVTTLVDKFGALPAVMLTVFLLFGRMGVMGSLLTVATRGVGTLKDAFVGASGVTGRFGAVTKASLAGASTGVVLFGTKVATTFTAIKASMMGLIASTGIGIAFIALGAIMEVFIKRSSEAKKKSEELAKMNKLLIESYRSTGHESGVKSLIGEHDQLLVKQKLAVKGSEEHTKVTNELNEIIAEISAKFPTMIDYVDEQGVAHLKTSDDMKEQIKSMNDLSEAQANIDIESFNEDIVKQSENYQKLTKELAKLVKEQKNLEESNGKIKNGPRGMAERQDTTDDVAMSKMEQVMKQAEITEAVQKTLGVVKNASLAYQEQSGTLKYLGDAQQKTIENFIGMNGEILRSKDLSVESQNTLFEFGNSIGDVFANARKKMEEAIGEKGFSTEEERLELDKLAMHFDNISFAIPEDMFNLDSEDDIPKVTEKITKMVDVLKDVDENTSFASIKQSLMDVGFSSKEAEQAVKQLDVAQTNAKLASDIQKEGLDETGESLDQYAEKVLEAIDLTEKLFGLSNSDYSAIEDHLQYMDILVGKYDESVTSSEEYQTALKAVAELLGISNEELAKSPHKWEQIAREMQKVDFGTYKDNHTQTYDQWVDSIEGISQATKDYMKSQDFLGVSTEELAEQTDGATEATKEKDEATKNLALSEEELKVKVDELAVVFQKLKEDGSVGNRDAWTDTVRGQLEQLGSQIILTKDENGKLKIAMADGSESPYLSSLQAQMGELGFDLVAVKDESGNLKLMLNDGTNSLTLTTLQSDLDETGLKIDDTTIKVEELDEQEIKPEVDVDFEKLTGGLGDVETALGDLDGAFAKIKENVDKLNGLKGVIGELKDMFKNLGDSMTGLFSNSKGDFEALGTKAKNAMTAVDLLKKSIDNIKTLASKVDTKGIENIKETADEAKKAIKKLGEELELIPRKSTDMSSVVVTANDKAKKAIKEHKEAIEKLGKKYSSVKTDVSKAMGDMKSKVSSTTDSMNKKHNSQSKAIEAVAKSARDAKSDIGKMNTSISSAMAGMNSYIAKANEAQKAGSSVPKAPSTGGGMLGLLFGKRSVTGNTGDTSANEGITTAMSTFSASAGEATGGASSGVGGGTSGAISQPIYNGGVNLDGAYQFEALASKEKEKKADLFKPNYNERAINSYESIVSQIEAKMQRIAKSTWSYRKSLKDVIGYQNKILSLSQKELKVVEARQSSISRRIKSLGSTSKHTVKQREEYNNIQSEYDSNLGKISSLKQTLQSITNEIKSKSEEIFSNFIDEIVEKYEVAIDKLKAKTDDIEFKIDVLALTNPDDIKKQLGYLAEKSNVQQEERNTLANKTSSLDSQYKSASKKYGSNSEQAKKVKTELDAVKEAWEDVTLAVLRTEKEIKDVRAQVADESIKQLKDYYGNMKAMAVSAIEAEKKALDEAHKKKMSQYDEQTKAINTVYDAQFKKMDAEKSHSEHQEQLDEKNLKKSELLNKISLLSRDTTLEGRKKIEELKKELADAEKDVSDFMKQRQETLLKEELDTQKQAQLDAIELKKETEEETYEKSVGKLDTEKESVEKKYDDLLNNDKMWADKRKAFISGSFSALTKELQTMSDTLAKMDKGNFDMLTKSYTSFSSDVKKQVASMNAMEVDNMRFGVAPALTDAKGVSTATKAKKVTTGTKVTTPTMTSAPAKPKAPAPKPAPKPKPKPKEPAPKPKGNRYHTIKKGDTLWDIAKAFYGNGTQWKKIYEANKNPDPRKLQIGRKLLVPFESGGYTGDWVGNEGKVAMLHKKEVVLDRHQTRDILDTAKIMGKIKDIIPNLKRNNFTDKMGDGETSIASNYNLTINIDRLNGDKEGANTVVKEIMKGLKKLGK